MVQILFLSLLLATLVGLASVVWTGLRGRRRAHFALLGITLPTFVVTIVMAERLARSNVFEPGIFGVHMVCAHAAAATLLAAIATGLWRAVESRRRPARPATVRAHRGAVILFGLSAVAALATGSWMLRTARPKGAEIDPASVTRPLDAVRTPVQPLPATLPSGSRRGQPVPGVLVEEKR